MTRDDTSIQKQVEDALKDSRFLSSTDIQINTQNGEVTLYGMVDVLAEKWAAGEIAEQVPGVIAVDNSLTVAMDRAQDDHEIEDSVREQLAENALIDLHHLGASVKGGVVYLEGDARSSAEVEAAREISARVYGVKDVISLLRIGGRHDF